MPLTKAFSSSGWNIFKSIGTSILCSLGLHAFAVVAVTFPGLTNSDDIPVSLNPGPGTQVQFELVEAKSHSKDAVILAAPQAPPETEAPVIKKESVKKTPKKPIETAQAATPSSNPGEASNKAQASQSTGGGRAARNAEEAYLALIQASLNSRIHYPQVARRLGQHGRVMVEFQVARDGKILGTHLVEKTPFTQINNAAKALVEGVNSLPPFPLEIKKEIWTLKVPIHYSL